MNLSLQSIAAVIRQSIKPVSANALLFVKTRLQIFSLAHVELYINPASHVEITHSPD